MRRLAAVITLTVCACTCGKKEGGIEANIDFDGYVPGCIEVTATDAKNAANTDTQQVVVTENRRHTVGVFLANGWSHTVNLTIVGHERGCSSTAINTVTDSMIDVPYGPPLEKTYVLSAHDADHDGYVAKADMGADCDDTNMAVHPGQPELCSNGLDDDCGSGTDCGDAKCLGMECAAVNGVCRPTPGICQAIGCVQVFADAGTSCGAMMKCRSDGVCVPGNTELNCSDGLDDDMDDAGIDCQDSDCNGAGCNAGLCKTGATCTGGVCVGANKDCGPAAGCHDAGICNPTNGQCDLPPLPMGTPCNDGNACTSNDVCNGVSTTCAGTMSCTATGCGTPFCDAGACDVAPASGGACNDGNPCTHTDLCTGGNCMGTAYSCMGAPAPVCQMASGCAGDGGCVFAPVANGSACDGGTCMNGGCAVSFPYVPSNVNLAQIPPSGDVRISCRVTLNTDDPASATWCDGGTPAIYPVTQVGSAETALVLSMNKLTMPATGGLRAFGSRPLIMVVWDTTITQVDGVIDVRSTQGDAGAGADRPSCGAQVGDRGGTNSANLASGGGGGGYAFAGAKGGQANGPAFPGGDGGDPILPAYAPLLGGCPGGRGGAGSGGAGTFGQPGSGGGAVQLSTAGDLRVGATARITASGGGGARVVDNSESGGGGGGSGGMILLEGRIVTMGSNMAWLTANGGAGAEGADNNEPGNPGEDGDWLSSARAAGGAGGAGNGGNGGDGANGTGYGGGVPENNKDTGGGGGGAVGRIYLRAIAGCTHAASFSPSPSTDGGCP